MKNRYTSLITFYSLTFLLILFAVNVRAQDKIVFTDDFSDNHNNWPVKGKKISISKETGYKIDITKSKEDFVALQTVPISAAKDFEITMKILNDVTDQSVYYMGGIFFGAKDEKNGYAVCIYAGGSVEILKWTDGVPNVLFRVEPKYRGDGTEKTITIKSEHGRWKIGTIANIQALPFMGDKAGVYVQHPGEWQIHSLQIVEKEKQAGLAGEDFPLALFMTRFLELKCDAESRFSENVDQSKDYMYKDLPFNKSIPGFDRPIIIYKENNIELLCGKRFYELDKAYTWFDDLKGAINLSSGSCLKYLKYVDNEQVNNLFKDFIKHGYWETTSTDIKKGKMYDMSTTVIQVLDEGTLKDSGIKYYLVGFHIVINWREK